MSLAVARACLTAMSARVSGNGNYVRGCGDDSHKTYR